MTLACPESAAFAEAPRVAEDSLGVRAWWSFSATIVFSADKAGVADWALSGLSAIVRFATDNELRVIRVPRETVPGIRITKPHDD